MRLFAAVLPPEDVVRELAVEVAELRKLPGADRLRWTARPGWHFTQLSIKEGCSSRLRAGHMSVKTE